MFSLGIEPSMTSTNGASSSPATAWRKGWRNSSPPRVGDRTLLCRCTFGSPGMAPRSTSSMPGWPAAVTDTESPSQLIPSEIQRMCTSSTAAGAELAAMAPPSVSRHRLFELERVDQQLLAAEQLEVQRATRGAAQRELAQLGMGAAAAAAAGRRHRFEDQLGALDGRALRHQLESELERARNHLAQMPDPDLHPRDSSPRRVPVGDPDDGLRDRELVHGSADPGKRIAHQLVHDPPAAEGGV